MTKPFVNVMNAVFISTDEDFLLLNHLDLFESCPSNFLQHLAINLPDQILPILSRSELEYLERAKKGTALQEPLSRLLDNIHGDGRHAQRRPTGPNTPMLSSSQSRWWNIEPWKMI